jgi:hypothetical protein
MSTFLLQILITIFDVMREMACLSWKIPKARGLNTSVVYKDIKKFPLHTHLMPGI